MSIRASGKAVGCQANDSKKAEEDDTKVCAEHINLTMGKIDEFEDAVDHSIAKRNERIYTAKGKTVY